MAALDELAMGELGWDPARYEAVLQSDAEQDGRFFLAVKTTGIFCYPSCSCRKPHPENVRFFVSAAAAQQAGFRPCKRCRPDLEGGVRGFEQALVRQAINLADRAKSPADLAERLAVSPAYLNRLLRRHQKTSLGELLIARRVARAANLLRAGLPPLEVATAAGFGSLSSFYQAFRRAYGLAPGEYQERVPGEQQERPGGAEPAAGFKAACDREAAQDAVHRL